MAATVFELKSILRLDSSEFEKGITGASSTAGGFTNVLGKIGKAAIAAFATATTAVVAFGGNAVKTSQDFDKAMSQVQATMLKTSDEMQNEFGTAVLQVGDDVKNFSGNLRDFAQFLGANTAFSATEAAQALNYMALAGYDTQQSMDMLPNVLNLAAAGGFNLARASDMVTDTQTAFGISAERTTQMVDEMAKAASTGNTSVEQLGDAFLVVGGLAKELNDGIVFLEDGTDVAVDGITELEIALTAMANAGVKGSEAGTHMRNMLMKLTSPTKEGVEQLEALGVNIFDAEGKMNSLSNIMFQLSHSMKGLTQEQRLKAVADLFNARDLSSAQALLTAIDSDWDKIGRSIVEAKGSAGEMAGIQLDNLAGDTTLLKSAWEGLQIVVSDQLTPTLRKFTQFASKSVSTLTEGFQSGGITGAMEAFGGILSEGLTMVTTMLPSILQAGKTVLVTFVQGIVQNIPQIVQAALEAWTTIETTIFELFPTIIQAGIDILVQLALGLAQAIPELIPVAIDAVFQILDTLIENIPVIVDAGIQVILALIQGVTEALPQIIEKMPEVLQSVLQALLDALPMLIEAGVQMIPMIITGILDALPHLLTMLPTVIIAIVSTLIANLPMLIETGIKMIPQIIAGIIQAIPSLIAFVPQIIVNIIKALGEAAMSLIESGKEIVDKVKEGFKQKIEDAKQWGKDLIQNFKDGITQRWENLKNGIKSVGQGIKNLLGFSEPKEGPLSDFHTYAPDMMNLFAKGIKDNEDVVYNQLRKSFDLDDYMSGLGTVKVDGNAQTSGSKAEQKPLKIVVQSVLNKRIVGEEVYDFINGRIRAGEFA